MMDAFETPFHGVTRAEITVEQVLRELAKIGFSDIRKAVAWRNEMVAREDEEAGKGEDGVVSSRGCSCPG